MRNGNDRSILHMGCKYFEDQRDIYGEDLLVRQKDIFFKTDVKADFSPLENFRRSIENCARCNLSHTRKTFVFGTGKSNASLMLIGEAPGRDEDIQGEPFVGQAGHLLEKILNAIGFEKNEVYICNILKS